MASRNIGFRNQHKERVGMLDKCRVTPLSLWIRRHFGIKAFVVILVLLHPLVGLLFYGIACQFMEQGISLLVFQLITKRHTIVVSTNSHLQVFFTLVLQDCRDFGTFIRTVPTL